MNERGCARSNGTAISEASCPPRQPACRESDPPHTLVDTRIGEALIVCRRVLRHRVRARDLDDCVQDAMLGAFARAGDGAIADWGAFVSKIAQRVASRWARTWRRRKERELPLEVELVARASESRISSPLPALSPRLGACQLPERARQVLQMLVLGNSVQFIRELLGLSVQQLERSVRILARWASRGKLAEHPPRTLER